MISRRRPASFIYEAWAHIRFQVERITRFVRRLPKSNRHVILAVRRLQREQLCGHREVSVPVPAVAR